MEKKVHTLAGAAASFAHLLGLARKKTNAAPQLPSRIPTATRRPTARSQSSIEDGSDLAAEMVGNGPVADARRRERARCEAIIRAGMAAGQRELGVSLACETTIGRRQAIEFINSRVSSQAAAPKRGSWSRAFNLAASGRSTPIAPDRYGWDGAFQRARNAPAE